MGAGTVFMIGLIIILVIAVAFAERRRNTRIIEARVRYRDALARLQRQPTDKLVYEHTQKLGRELIGYIARSRGSETPFTEATLQNDLDTATRR